MTYPAYETPGVHGATEWHAGPVTCEACGCRLQPSLGAREAWFHFAPMGGRDARGCRVACVERAHDAHGRAAAG